MPEPTEYDHKWASAFGELPPIAYELRVLLPDRWVRFHSLPESKRYATGEAEYTEILRRWNLLVDEVLRGRPGWMITTGVEPEGIAALATRIGTQPTRMERGFHGLDAEPDEPGLPLHGWTLPWRPGLLDPWFRQIADDEQFNTLILDEEFQRVVAPYGGGIDLILATHEERDRLRERYPDWLSRHPSGT